MICRSESDKITVAIKGSCRSIKVGVFSVDRVFVQCIRAMPQIWTGAAALLRDPMQVKRENMSVIRSPMQASFKAELDARCSPCSLQGSCGGINHLHGPPFGIFL